MIACVLQILLWMLFLLLQYFIRGILIDALDLFRGTPLLWSHVATIRILILTNCYGIMNLLLRKFTFTENQTFLRNFYTTKIWSHTVFNYETMSIKVQQATQLGMLQM